MEEYLSITQKHCLITPQDYDADDKHNCRDYDNCKGCPYCNCEIEH